MIVVIVSAILVSATNLVAGHDSSGFLFGYFGAGDNYENPLENKMFLKSGFKTNLAMAPLIEPKSSSDSQDRDNFSEDGEVFVQGQALISGNSPVLRDPEEDGGVIIYEVKDGDTVSSIASSHRISMNTILWANEIENVDMIKPGDEIFILPITGLSYIVKNGDNIDSICKQFKADKEKVIAFNYLPANGKVKEGQEIMIPEGQKEVPRRVISGTSNIALRQYESFSSSSGKSTLSGKAGAGHRFPYGYCTWYVASRRYIPWSGNAGTWLYRAKSMGYATSKTPTVGSIMVSSESWWGHVAIVEKISGDMITISEMNYKGWAKKSSRTLSSKSRVIKGFIR